MVTCKSKCKFEEVNATCRSKCRSGKDRIDFLWGRNIFQKTEKHNKLRKEDAWDVKKRRTDLHIDYSNCKCNPGKRAHMLGGPAPGYVISAELG